MMGAGPCCQPCPFGCPHLRNTASQPLLGSILSSGDGQGGLWASLLALASGRVQILHPWTYTSTLASCLGRDLPGPGKGPLQRGVLLPLEPGVNTSQVSPYPRSTLGWGVCFGQTVSQSLCLSQALPWGPVLPLWHPGHSWEVWGGGCG